MITTPSNFKKRILVAVSGLSPAILTETIYALAVKNTPEFIPTEVHLITTIEGKLRAENTLLKGDSPKFKALCDDYQLSNINFTADNIHVIANQQGEAQDDIRTPEDNEAAADFITQTLFDLTRDPDSALHVSIAGGRKTMGYYVGYALSLFGRQQDRLSHVLVDMDYERCLDFFYPTPKAVIRNNLAEKPVDLSQAEVYLAEIPFVRIAPYMSEKDQLQSGKVRFSEAVALAQSSNAVNDIVIDAAQNQISIGEHKKDWASGDNELAFFIWFTTHCFNHNGEVEAPAAIKDDEGKYTLDYNQAYSEAFLNTYRSVVPHSAHAERVAKPLKNGMNYGFFSEKKSRVNSTLRKMFGPELASQFEIKQVYLEGKTKRGKKKAGFFTVGVQSHSCQVITP